MKRTACDLFAFLGSISLATTAGATLYGDKPWATTTLIIAGVAWIAWAITKHHQHRSQPIPYTITHNYNIDELVKLQQDAWDQRGTTTHTIQLDQHNINITNAEHIEIDHLPVWPNEIGAPE